MHNFSKYGYIIYCNSQNNSLELIFYKKSPGINPDGFFYFLYFSNSNFIATSNNLDFGIIVSFESSISFSFNSLSTAQLTKVITNEEGKNIPVIDSREVAEMLGKSHSAVLKDIQGSNDGKTVGIIPTLLKSNFDLSKYFIESSYKDQSGKSNKCYLCTKMGCELLGNKQQGEKGILFTAKYVERFNEMERQLKELQTPKLPQTYLEALKALVKSEEEKQQVEKELEETKEELEDKNSFIGKISASENSLLVREVAKLASKGNVVIGEKALWNKLREWGYISKKSTEPMQSAINAGWFEVIERVVDRDGKSFVYRTTKVTSRGQIHIIKKLSKEHENKLKKIQ